MKFEIKNRFTGELIFSIETDTWRLAVEAAIKNNADLSSADLRSADLRYANLRFIKADLWELLLHAKHEISALRKAIIDGKVDGSVYEGECACLCGTIANERKCKYTELNGIIPDSSRPAEAFFTAVKKGDTPETNQVAKIVLGWIDELQELIK